MPLSPHQSSNVKLERLSKVFDLSEFKCGNGELDDFLISDALEYQKKCLANTTLMISNERIVNYFSLAADSILLTSEEKIEEDIEVEFSSFPAIKIARLATQTSCQGNGYGKKAVKYCLGLARHLSDDDRHDAIGCRFVTVDAYQDAVDWYKKLGFVENIGLKRRNRETISLRLDILPVPEIKPE